MTKTLVAHSANTKPQFTHDCEACVFLGSQFPDAEETMDFWISENNDLIVRRGSDEPDYSALPVVAAIAAAVSTGPGSTWSQAVSRYDDYVDATKSYYEFVPLVEPKYETVVGLYEDIQVKETSKNLFFRDRHGNPLGIAKKDAYLIENGQGEAFMYQPDMNIGGCSLSDLAPRLINTRKALYLFVMYLNQLSVDTGH